MAALPKGVAIGQNHIAGLSNLGAIGELIIGIHITDLYLRDRIFHPVDII